MNNNSERWIKTKDDLPKQGEFVTIFTPFTPERILESIENEETLDPQNQVCHACFIDGSFIGSTVNKIYVFEPTHWQPLPTPPKTEQNEN